MTKDSLTQLSRNWIGTALVFFLLAAILGLSMRYFFIADIPFLSYRNILHAHSHTALFGWGYLLLSGSFMVFLGIDSRQIPKVSALLIVNIIATAGMLVSFLWQGYGPVSISFCTLQLISMYVFAYIYLKDSKKRPKSSAKTLIKWSLYWQLISTLGLWAIAPVSIFLGKLHPLYSASVQFFMHFQLNGWFTFAVLGLLFSFFSKRGKEIELSNTTFWILQISLVLTYFLSVTWSTPIDILFYINSIGVTLQLLAFILIFKTISRAYPKWISFRTLPDALLSIGLLSLFFKVLIQSAVVIPSFAIISYTIHNFVIAFIHLIMLGSITMTMAGILLKSSHLPADSNSLRSWFVLLCGFLLTEFILFGQGLLLMTKNGFVSYYYEIIFSASALLPLGVFLILLSWIRSPKRALMIPDENQLGR